MPWLTVSGREPSNRLERQLVTSQHVKLHAYLHRLPASGCHLDHCMIITLWQAIQSLPEIQEACTQCHNIEMHMYISTHSKSPCVARATGVHHKPKRHAHRRAAPTPRVIIDQTQIQVY